MKRTIFDMGKNLPDSSPPKAPFDLKREVRVLAASTVRALIGLGACPWCRQAPFCAMDCAARQFIEESER